MLEKIKILLGISEDDESKDELLSLLISIAKEDAIDFCHLKEYDDSLNTIVMRMVVELYHKRGNEGLTQVSFAGVSEHYESDYSDAIVRQLIRNRRLVSV